MARASSARIDSTEMIAPIGHRGRPVAEHDRVRPGADRHRPEVLVGRVPGDAAAIDGGLPAGIGGVVEHDEAGAPGGGVDRDLVRSCCR